MLGWAVAIAGIAIGFATFAWTTWAPTGTAWLALVVPWIGEAVLGLVLGSLRRAGKRGGLFLGVWTTATCLVVVSLAAGKLWKGNVVRIAVQASGQVDPSLTEAWTDGHRAALTWIAVNAPTEDLIATNRLCSNPTEAAPECASRVFLAAALTHRQILLEGYAYSVDVRPQGPGR